jgi:predicted methyltransferase/thioredoxin-related protein
MKQRLSIAILATIVFTLSIRAQVATRTPFVGQLAPAFSTTTTDGKTIALSDYRGRVVLVEFWASWCTQCNADLPTVKQLNQTFPPSEFSTLGISMDEDPAALRAKVKEKDLHWPQIMDGRSFDGDLAKSYNVQGTPAYFVIDRVGRVAARTGDVTKLQAAISAAVARQSTTGRMADRDSWQRPAYVLDELGITAGSYVADVGAGEGYFTMHLADRVGTEGRVYAVDINNAALDSIESKSKARGWTQVVTILGTPTDPRLPQGSLDAILIVNAYHEFVEFDSMLQSMYRALKPGGLIGIIDNPPRQEETRAQYQREHTLPESIVREDLIRNGFSLKAQGDSFRNGMNPSHEWFFLIFKK